MVDQCMSSYYLNFRESFDLSKAARVTFIMLAYCILKYPAKCESAVPAGAHFCLEIS